jgi:hypothetical protein
MDEISAISRIRHFHTFQKGEGGLPSIESFEIEVSEEEVELLKNLISQKEVITEELSAKSGSSLARQYVVSKNLNIPWAFTLRKRTRTIELLNTTQASNREFFSIYTRDELLQSGFSDTSLLHIEKFRDDIEILLHSMQA